MDQKIELGKAWFNYESFNTKPILNNENLLDEDEDLIYNGYAATIQAPIEENFYWLAFKNVDDHIDGNGLSTLYLTQGKGKFYYGEDQVIDVIPNTVILFDDNVEHGFSSEELCMALNITWGEYIPTEEEVKQKIEQAIQSYSLEQHISKIAPYKKMQMF